MELREVTTSKLNSTSQTQSPRLIDRIIRLKTIYWNREFAIVMLTFIGLYIQKYQCHSLIWSILEYQEIHDEVNYFMCGMCIGFVLGGILAVVYSAHKIFGISFIILSICHFMELTNYSNVHLHFISLFCIGMTLAMASSASHRIYSFWMPLNKQSLRHVPILLWSMINLYIIQIYKYHLLGIIIGLAWFVLWLNMINGDRSQSPNRDFKLFGLLRGSNTAARSSKLSVISLRRSTILDIPWKSFCTSMPVIVLVLSYMCYSIGHVINLSLNNYYLSFNWSMRKYTTILLLLLFVLIELFPEITVRFSVTNVRKFFSCMFMVLMGFLLLLDFLPNRFFLFIETNNLPSLIFNLMVYFSLFGFEINHLDIAPKYVSVLYGLNQFIYYTFFLYLPTVIKKFLSYEILNDIQIRVLVAVICFAMAVVYAIFASAELQSWAEDKPAKENQRNIQEEINLTAV